MGDLPVCLRYPCGIRALEDLSVCVTNANKLSGAVAGAAIGVKILIFTLISASLVYH